MKVQACVNDLESTIPGARWLETLQMVGADWEARAIIDDLDLAVACRAVLFSAALDADPKGRGMLMSLDIPTDFPASLGVATRLADGSVVYDPIYIHPGHQAVLI